MPDKALLNERQEKFVLEYLVDLNATQAAIRAGYSPKTAYSIGQRLLKHVEISRQIAEAREEQATRTGVTADRVLLEFAHLALSDIRDVMSWDADGTVTVRPSDAIDENAARAIQSIKSRTTTRSGDFGEITTHDLEVRFHPKDPALQALARHLDLFSKEGDRTAKSLLELLTAGRHPDAVK